VTDSRVKGRVKGLFGGATPDTDMPEPTMGLPDPDTQRQALQVLVLAQRTADEHVASARHQSDRIRADARATAEQIAREAQAHAESARHESAQALSQARAAAEQIVREAKAHADGTRRDAEKLLSDARAQAEKIGKAAQEAADGLGREAQQRYDDVVGSLAAKRSALQEQIEVLQQFDRDYRARLRVFMQGQLDALGVDEPPTGPEPRKPAAARATGSAARANGPAAAPE
jgi:cell division septum initiation protein DivIVA